MIKKRLLIFIFVGVLLITPMVLAQEGKFTQTFQYRIGGNSLNSGDEILLAKYDLISLERFHYDDIGGDTWGAIRALNPNIEITLYQSGITVFDSHDGREIVYMNNLGRWNNDRGHSMGSLNGDRPELFLLNESGDRINYIGYTNRWILDFGLSDFQDYFIEGTIHDIAKNYSDVPRAWAADGIYVDNTISLQSAVASKPAKYPTDGTWFPAMNDFVNAVTAGFHNENQKAWFNRGRTGKVNGSNAWIALDNMPSPPDAILEEGAFAVGWGPDDVQFFPQDQWKRQIDLMSQIHNSKTFWLAHTALNPGESGVDNMNPSRPVDFWDALWYSLASFQLGKNTVDNNSYFSFVRQEAYNTIWWFDEFSDIDLGNTFDVYQIDSSSGNNIYWREFENGYVYVNPTKNDVSNIILPEISKQLNHNNFKDDPTTITNITTIDLVSHRGTFLLKAQSSPSCTHSADSDNDCSIDVDELTTYISQWKQNTGITISQVIEAIGIWKGGGY